VASRFLIGSTLLLAITAGLASTAPAQDRMTEMKALMDRAREKRDEPSDPNPTKIVAAGTYRFNFQHDGIRREYLVHVPAKALGHPAPMVLALHGGGGDMDFQAGNYGLVEKSDAAGFIAVFPSGYSRFASGILGTWNAGKCCGQARDKAVDDVGFLKAVIARVEMQVDVDPRRVFATGMSNGAMMAYRLACEAPELVRAIAPVAGTDNTNACTPARPVPVIHFHAKDDDHVLFNGGAGPGSFRNTGAVNDFTSVPATIAQWVKFDHAAAQAKPVLTVAGASCERHDGLAPVELCVTESGGHSWPGSRSRRANKDPSQAINANDLMWSFFSSLK
jgi:polyhydroxybutyrate depolymerase